MMRVKREAVALNQTPAGLVAQAAPVSVDSALEQLRGDLQYAMELEHATIPLYLYVLYSLVDAPGRNAEIRGIIRSVVLEEMGHLALAGNILCAIGGTPDLTSPKFLPEYPGKLPFDIGNVEVSLQPFSIDLVKNVFLAIEQPEGGPTPFPVAAVARVADGQTFQTIGEFYATVSNNLRILAGQQPIFQEGRPQLTGILDVFPVRTLDDAIAAINRIVRQGEGTKGDPREGLAPMLAHYYRFNEIVEGQTLVRDPMADLGYSYSGFPIPFDAQNVIPLPTNPRNANYPADSKIARLSLQFNTLYHQLLTQLQCVYAAPDSNAYDAVALMYDLKIVAQRLTSAPIPGSNPVTYAAPTFEMPAIPVVH